MTEPFGPEYVWQDANEYNEAMRRMSMTPYQMAREFRTVFGQPLDIAVEPTVDDITPDEILAVRIIEEEDQEFLMAIDEEHVEGSEAVLKELADKVYVAYGYAALRGWNLDKALARIHLSNMTKVDPVTGTIIKREDGKVSKGLNYKPPYLKDLV